MWKDFGCRHRSRSQMVHMVPRSSSWARVGRVRTFIAFAYVAMAACVPHVEPPTPEESFCYCGCFDGPFPQENEPTEQCIVRECGDLDLTRVRALWNEDKNYCKREKARQWK